MKPAQYFASFILCFIFINLQSEANCRKDSVVVSYFSESQNSGTTRSVSIDTFDLDIGVKASCIKNMSNAGIWTNYHCVQSFWKRTTDSLDNQGLLIESLTEIGSPAGWINFSRVKYSYNSNNQLLIEEKQNWNGVLWETYYLHELFYDVQNNLVEETVQSDSGGSLINEWKRTWAYSSSQLLSRTMEKGDGAGWRNDSAFTFSYDSNGMRDSAWIQIWDTINGTWNNYGPFKYFYQGSTRVINIINDSKPIIDIVKQYSIDTLENLLQYSEQKNIISSDSIHGYYSGQNLTYNYFANQLKLTREYAYHEDYMISGIDTFIVGATAPVSNTYQYDSSSRLISSKERLPYTHPWYAYTDYTYLAGSILQRITRDEQRGNYPYFSDRQFNYSVEDSVLISVAPWYSPVTSCPSIPIQSELFILGGCPPYTFHWTPSQGLSSDTVANPIIILGQNPVTYKIVVSDVNGKSDSLEFEAVPTITATITTTSPTCTGCPTILTAVSNSCYTYQWYRNQIPIPSATLANYSAYLNGSYHVEINNVCNPCTVVSDKIDLMTVGITELASSSLSVQLFPNPALSQSVLTIQAVKTGTILVYLYDIEGREKTVLYENTIVKDDIVEIPIKTEMLDHEIYLLQIQSSEEVKNLRLIVVKE